MTMADQQFFERRWYHKLRSSSLDPSNVCSRKGTCDHTESRARAAPRHLRAAPRGLRKRPANEGRGGLCNALVLILDCTPCRNM